MEYKMFIKTSDDVKINLRRSKKLTKIIENLSLNEKLPITVTVYIAEANQVKNGNVFNTIKIHYPNLGRKKDQPSEIEIFYKVLCVNGYIRYSDDTYRSVPLLNMNVINRFVANYQQYGEVTLIAKNLYLLTPETTLIYPDGSQYDWNFNKIN